jgi:hypothetical protein
MASTNPVIPVEKVCEVIKSISAMGVWGTVTLNFEDGGVTKIIDNFVWKASDADKAGFVMGPSEQIKKPHPPAAKKRIVIRA